MVKKRIVICCDGTWQSSTTDKKNVPSNVSRLCRLLAREGKDENGQPVPQVIYYDSGIGTGEITYINQVVQGGTGAGIDINIIEAYNFIVLNYQEGDEIYCFGFSRGAYTARSVAGFITDFGVCDPEDLIHLHEAWAVYKNNTGPEGLLKSKAYIDWQKETVSEPKPGVFNYLLGREKTRVQHASEFLKRASDGKENNKKVKVVGVWDTVGALGVPDTLISTIKAKTPFAPGDKNQYGFHNVRLSDNIEHAFQALALDEHRKPFGPTLFHKLPKGKTDLKQVWFPGVHINCGGGSDDQLESGAGDLEELANITLAWMLEQVGPFLAFNKSRLQEELKSQDALRADLFKAKGNTVDKTRGYGTGPLVDSADEVKYTLQKLDRTPGEYGEPKKSNVEDATTLTNEQIHPVAAFRNRYAKEQGTDYEPRGLAHFERRKRADGNGYEWKHKTKKDPEGKEIIIPEWVVPRNAKDGTNINLERVVITDDAKAWFKELDAVNKV